MQTLKRYKEIGCVTIQRGVPWRRGIYKHSVVDGSMTRSCATSTSLKVLDWELCGREVRISERYDGHFGTSIVGERGDSFVVSTRLETFYQDKKGRFFDQSGYRVLWNSLSLSQWTRSCEHNVQYQDESVLLSASQDDKHAIERRDSGSAKPVIIHQTTGEHAVRWSILVWECQGKDCTMLKRPDCCVKCAMDQISAIECKGERRLII